MSLWNILNDYKKRWPWLFLFPKQKSSSPLFHKDLTEIASTLREIASALKSTCDDEKAWITNIACTKPKDIG